MSKNHSATIEAFSLASKEGRVPLRASHFFALVLFTILAFLCVLPGESARAAEAKVIVNGSIITSNEITARAKLLGLMSGKGLTAATRQQAEKELVEEMLISQAAGRSGVSIADSVAKAQFDAIARSNRMQPNQFRSVISRSGADPDKFIQRLKAMLLWQKFAGTAIRNSVKINEQDIVAEALDKGIDANNRSQIYTFTSILFVLPKTPSKAAISGKLAEAQKLKRQIKSCDDLGTVRRLDNVVIRENTVKRAADLPPPLVKTLNSLTIGGGLDPGFNGQVVELIILCDRQEVSTSAELFSSIENKLVNTETLKAMRRVLYELRRSAVIERR